MDWGVTRPGCGGMGAQSGIGDFAQVICSCVTSYISVYLESVSHLDQGRTVHFWRLAVGRWNRNGSWGAVSLGSLRVSDHMGSRDPPPLSLRPLRIHLLGSLLIDRIDAIVLLLYQLRERNKIV